MTFKYLSRWVLFPLHISTFFPISLIHTLVKFYYLEGDHRLIIPFHKHHFVWSSQQPCKADVVFLVRKLKDEEANILPESHTKEAADFCPEPRTATKHHVWTQPVPHQGEGPVFLFVCLFLFVWFFLIPLVFGTPLKPTRMLGWVLRMGDILNRMQILWRQAQNFMQP